MGGDTEGAQGRLNGTVERLNLFVQKVDVRELHRQQLPMVVVDEASQSLLEQRDLRAHASFREFCHRGWIHPPRDERLQHCTPRDPHNIGNHRGELDIGAFQHPLDALHLTDALLHELRPIRNYPEPLTNNCLLHKGIELFLSFRRRHVWLWFVLALEFFIL